jgi:hypothetical protein
MGALDAQESDPLGVADTLALCELVPGLLAVGIVDPRRAERAHFRAVENQIQRHRGRIVALKAYLGYVHFGPDDPAYRPYFRLAARYQLPVIFHTGDTWSVRGKLKYSHPLRVDEVAVDNPDVQFVLAHMGVPWYDTAAELILKNENVWADLSGLYVGDENSLNRLLEQDPPPAVSAGVELAKLKSALGYAGEYSGYARILYGSDWPLAPMKVYRRFVEAVVPPEHHEKVFWKNAERLLFGNRGSF